MSDPLNFVLEHEIAVTSHVTVAQDMKHVWESIRRMFPQVDTPNFLRSANGDALSLSWLRDLSTTASTILTVEVKFGFMTWVYESPTAKWFYETKSTAPIPSQAAEYLRSFA